MHNFRNLDIWKVSLSISTNVIELTKSFPNENRFDLTQQIIRSAISIPSNIAEGSSRKSRKEFAHYLNISIGSAFELETQLSIATKIYNANYEQLINELVMLQKKIYNFRRQLISN
jgi:four helix bundle protein